MREAEKISIRQLLFGRHAGFKACSFYILPFFMLLTLFLGLSDEARAAFKSSKDGSLKEEAYNPVPQMDDISLPMPCGLQMVFRAVAVPVSSPLQDRTFRMGVVNLADSGRTFYERQFDGHISAPFSINDLPDQWRSLLGDKNVAGDKYYFVGKYEVSRLQWQAVMDTVNEDGLENREMCAKIESGEGNLPQGGISWFDAQKFLQKYNAWLVREHAEVLPRFKDTPNIGFLRLPTEAEWEYAARGGPHVPLEWWEDKDIFPFEQDRNLKDYGIFNSEGSRRSAAPIGSRNPNPLGLHDTVGNLREMVDGFFRLSVSDLKRGSLERRLHGAAGGILTKGGSFLSQEAAVMPGARDELPIFTANGELRPADLGMRVVLSSLNIPDAHTLETLRREEAREPAGEGEAVSLENQNNPLEAVKLLAAKSEGTFKSNLEKVVSLMEDQQNAENLRHLQSVEHSLHSLLYQAETLRAFALRYITAKKQIDAIEGMAKQSLDAQTRKKVDQALKEARTDLTDYLESLRMGANYYRQGLGAILDVDTPELSRMLARMEREYGGEGIFNEHIRQNIGHLESFVELAKTGGLSSVNSSLILKKTIPEQHLKQLPL